MVQVSAGYDADEVVADTRVFNDQLRDYTIITGTPKTVLPKIRHVLEYLRPGTICFWDGDGDMSHEDAMRSLRLMGSDVIPAVREISKELELDGSFEIDPATNQPYTTADAEPGDFAPPLTSTGRGT